MRIRDAIEADLDATINEIIKLSDGDERQVAQEIADYQITADLESHFTSILRRLQRGMQQGEQNVGFWVSGFYGSGKSSLVKVLSYALENVPLKGRSASSLFLERTTGASDLARALEAVVAQKPVVVRFDLQGDRDLTAYDNEPFSAIAWRAIRRALGYADSLRLSELEIRLEEEDKLRTFEAVYDERFGKDAWQRQKHKEEPGLDNASAVLNQLWRDVYTSEEVWASRERAIQLTANTMPERAAALVDRRRGKGRPLILIADEVGHFIGRSADRMQDVQGLVEALAKVLRGRAWFFVTAQERLDSVFTSLAGVTERQKSELPKLRDRFQQIDLAPKDIGEVTQRRLLRKTPSGNTELAARYQAHKDALKVHTDLKGAAAFVTSPELGTLTESNFVSFYPFLPYQVDLVLHIISGIRDQGGVHRLTGGAARTLIRLVQDVLTHHPQLRLAERMVGDLVTLDAVYDQQEANLPGERRSDLDSIKTAFAEDEVVLKVAKALCVLEYADARMGVGVGGESKSLVPRTPENLAAVLHPSLNAPSQLPEVEEALARLQEKRKARKTASGWELLTPATERWERERSGLRLLKEHRDAELREAFKRLLEDDASLRHPRGRRFSAGFWLDGKSLFPGSKDLRIEIRRGGGQHVEDVVRTAEADTRRDPLLSCWALSGDSALEDLAEEIVRSGKMIGQYESQAGPIYFKLLHDEATRLEELRRRLRQAVQAALLSGTLVVQGTPSPITDLGSNLKEVLRHALERLVATHFREYELAAMGAGESLIRSVLESPVESLPDLLRGAEGGIALFTRDQGRTVVSTDARVPSILLNAIGAQGRKGQELERQLDDPPYGWTEDTVRLISAALFRGGLIQVTHKGRTLTVASEPGALEPFTRREGFVAAVFTRRSDGVDNRARVAAAKALRLMGQEVNPDEAEIHRAVQRAAEAYRDKLVRLSAQLAALGLPGNDRVNRASESLAGLAANTASGATMALAGSGQDLAEQVDWALKLERTLTPEAVGRIQGAREAVAKLIPALRAAQRLPADLQSDTEKLEGWLQRDGLVERLPEVARITGALSDAYAKARGGASSQRAIAYHDRLERLRADPSFAALAKQDPARTERISASLVAAAEPVPGTAPWELPSLAGLSADLAAAEGRLREAIIEVERALAPPGEPPEIIPVRRYIFGAVSEEKELNDRIESLRDACLRALRRGRKVILE